MTDTFAAQVGAWVAKAERRVDAVFKASAQDVIAEMQEPGPSVANPASAGTGHMPIETGFLRSSLQARLNEPAGGMMFRPPSLETAAYDPSPVALVIAGAKLGDTIYATYAANYAPIMEERYAFVRLAAQNWQRIVSKTAEEAKRRAG